MKSIVAALRAAFFVSVALLGLFALSACGSTDADNAQTRAGISEAVVETAIGPDGKPYISGFQLTDGKERGNVSLTIQAPSGYVVTYSATDVAAFAGQKGRADLEAAIAEAWRDAAPGAVESLADKIVKLVIGVP